MKNIQTTAYIETRACPLGPTYNEFGYNKSVSLHLIKEPVVLEQTRHIFVINVDPTRDIYLGVICF